MDPRLAAANFLAPPILSHASAGAPSALLGWADILRSRESHRSDFDNSRRLGASSRRACSFPSRDFRGHVIPSASRCLEQTREQRSSQPAESVIVAFETFLPCGGNPRESRRSIKRKRSHGRSCVSRSALIIARQRRRRVDDIRNERLPVPKLA